MATQLDGIGLRLPARRWLRRMVRMPAEYEALRRHVLEARRAVDRACEALGAEDGRLEELEERLTAAASEWHEDGEACDDAEEEPDREEEFEA